MVTDPLSTTFLACPLFGGLVFFCQWSAILCQPHLFFCLPHRYTFVQYERSWVRVMYFLFLEVICSNLSDPKEESN
jgi:hypothetical protein